MSLDWKSGQPIVIDCGSGVIKAGFAGDDRPKVHLPCIVGKPKHLGTLFGLPNKKSLRPYVMGLELINRRGAYKLEYPFQNGVVNNWSAMASVYDHLVTYEMALDPSNHPVLFTEPFSSPKRHRELMAELFFEELSCPAVFVSYQSILSLYASGRIHGLVVDSGESITTTVPVYDTFDIRSCIKRQDFAGKQVTEYLIRLLTETGVRFFSSAEHEIARQMKEECCFVHDYYGSTVVQPQPEPTIVKEYKLPDGQILKLDSERFRAPEIIFHPSLTGSNCTGLGQLVFETLMHCDANVRNILANNTLLTGGNTMFRGFPERLLREVEYFSPNHLTVSIRAPLNRQDRNWVGGSILASLNVFPSMCVLKKEFQDVGPNIMHTKCI